MSGRRREESGSSGRSLQCRRGTTPAGWALALWLGLLAAPAAAVAQEGSPADVDQGARSAFEAGRDAYDRGRFDEALQHFERAYALSPRPLLLFNIGRAAEADLQTDKAIASYEAYLTAMPTAENREFVETRLQKLREMRGLPQPQPSPVAPTPVEPPPPPPLPVRVAPPVYEQTSLAPSGIDAMPRFRLYAGARLGVGGEYTEKTTDGTKYKYDLKATPGFQLGAAWVWRYFGIGGELRYMPLKIKNWPDPPKFLDIVVKPRGGYQLAAIPLEFYVAVPVGVAIPFVDFGGYDEDVWDSEPKADVGVTVGVQAGATYFFTKHIGLNLELGWIYYSYDTKATSDGDTYTNENSFGHFQLGLNATFGF